MEGVHIVYGKDGYGGSEVDAVFASRQSARKHVKVHIFGQNTAYSGKNDNELNTLADEHITYFEVEA